MWPEYFTKLHHHTTHIWRWGENFFLKYPKYLPITVIRKKSWIIQTTYSDKRPKKSTGYTIGRTFQGYRFKFRYYINGTQQSYGLHAPILSSEKSAPGYKRLFSTNPIVGCWKQLVKSCNLLCSLWRWCHMLAWTRMKLVSLVHDAHPLHEKYLTPLGGRYVHQRFSDNLSAPSSQGLLVVVVCLGGLMIMGDFRLSYTSLVNRVRCQAALHGIGVASSGSSMAHYLNGRPLSV